MSPWVIRVVIIALIAFSVNAQGDGIASEPEPVAAPTGAGAGASGPTTSSAADMSDDMRNILVKVGSVPCSDDVRARMYALLYDNNRVLHDKCYADCEYQFFPSSQQKPTTTQIAAAATSRACVTLFSGVILAKFPECDVDMVSTRSCAEILLRIKKDIDDKRAAPTQQQFFEFYNLNRVVNLLNENASLIEDVFRDSPKHITLWEMTKIMNRLYITPDIMLKDDMTILVRDTDKTTAEPGSANAGWKQANIAFSSRDGSRDGSKASGGSSSMMGATSGASSSSSAGPTPTLTPTAAASPPVVNETTKEANRALLRQSSGVLSMAVVLATSCYTWMHV